MANLHLIGGPRDGEVIETNHHKIEEIDGYKLYSETHPLPRHIAGDDYDMMIFTHVSLSTIELRIAAVQKYWDGYQNSNL